MQQTKFKKSNGVDVQQLVHTIDVIKGNPEVAKFNFRSHTKWLGGGHCVTEIKDFYGALQEDESRSESLIMEGDEPPILLGTNKAPNAVEAILHALASCLTVGIVYNAAAKGIDIYALQFDLNGDIDLHRFLGLKKNKRAGFQSIQVEIQVKSNVSHDEIRQLLSYVVDTSPVMDILVNPVPVRVNLNK